MSCYPDGEICETCHERFYMGVCLTCRDKLERINKDLLTALEAGRSLAGEAMYDSRLDGEAGHMDAMDFAKWCEGVDHLIAEVKKGTAT